MDSNPNVTLKLLRRSVSFSSEPIEILIPSKAGVATEEKLRRRSQEVFVEENKAFDVEEEKETPQNNYMLKKKLPSLKSVSRKERSRRYNSLMKKFGLQRTKSFETRYRSIHNLILDPCGTFYPYWLKVVALAVLYNIFMIIARSTFWKLHNLSPATWFFFDYLADAIYLCDMFVSFHTGYREQGILVGDVEKVRSAYFHSWQFWFDIISILPTDILYSVTGVECSRDCCICPFIIRINRIFHFYRIQNCFNLTEMHTTYPNAFRIAKMLLYIVIIIHWNSCFYFIISNKIGFGSDQWVYSFDKNPNETLLHMYLYSFYWSSMMLTTMGELSLPEKEIEYLFVLVDIFIGISIFATIVGNVGIMISNMNASRADFHKRIDAVKQYMEICEVDKEFQLHVIRWFEYLSINNQLMNEQEVLSLLPNKLRAEMAIHAHLNTLQQMKIFQGCEPSIFTELVLKLRLEVFSPGDYICHKGDIGKELYIVKRGKIVVTSEDDDGPAIRKILGNGEIFGEISVLNITDNNRRTASVRSMGYSDIFCLSKKDLWEVLDDYPRAKELLIERAKHILMRTDNM